MRYDIKPTRVQLTLVVSNITFTYKGGLQTTLGANKAQNPYRNDLVMR